MPKSLTTEEKRFLRHYVKEGGVEEKIRRAEQLARLKAGAGVKLLKLKRVQEEFRGMMEPIRLEQQRQAMLAEAVLQVTADLEAKKTEAENKLNEVLNTPLIPVQGNESRIDHELMRLVQLCPEKYGGIKLAAIKTAYVVAGLMEQGTTRRVIPADGKAESANGGVYTNVFDRLRLERAGEAVPAVPDPPMVDEVFELTPHKVLAPEPVQQKQIPPPGEAIGPVPVVAKKGGPRVITVDIG